MSRMRYSVACENEDVEDFDTKRQAVSYGKRQAKQGKHDIVVNVMTDDGQYLDCIVIA